MGGKISRVFFSPVTFFFLASLSWASSRGILVVFVGLSCETAEALGAATLHTTARELQTCTLGDPALQNTTKIPREDPQEREERMNIVAGEGKNKFWAVLRRRAVWERAARGRKKKRKRKTKENKGKQIKSKKNKQKQ